MVGVMADRLNSIGRCTISCTLVILVHFSLSLLLRFFPAAPLIIHLPLSVVVIFLVVGVGRSFRRVFGVSASAPALVFFNVLFVWAVFVLFVRKAISDFSNVLFNVEVALLFMGLCRILSSDPGFVSYGSPHSDKLNETRAFAVEVHNERVRYCKSCNAYVKGFDHHCPAFGNCIGEKNYALFIVILVGFLITEISYIVCTSHVARGSQILGETIIEDDLAENLIISTTIFSTLQLLWQVVFLSWHIYCICFNIRTDEWINWKNYPEFHLEVRSGPGENLTETRFSNPYDKGILKNLKEFAAIKC